MDLVPKSCQQIDKYGIKEIQTNDIESMLAMAPNNFQHGASHTSQHLLNILHIPTLEKTIHTQKTWNTIH